MNPTSNTPAAHIGESIDSEPSWSGTYGPLIFLGLIWAQLFWALHPTWIHGQYYDYGWIVAPVAAWFLWRRWSELPKLSDQKPLKKWQLVAVVLGSLVLLGSLFFVRTLERFDPIWRMPLILHGMIVFVATHVAIAIARGPRDSLSFFPMVLFAMTAIPWPTQAEALIIGEMTEKLLAVSAPLSRLIGLPVELSGSALIASDGRVIRIDEGCSGIRSFQSLIMAGLFVGEFMRLRLSPRVVLLVLAIVFGFLTNTLRAMTLTWIFFNDGQGAFDRAHDMVGFIAFGLAAGLLLLSGHFLERRSSG